MSRPRNTAQNLSTASLLIEAYISKYGNENVLFSEPLAESVKTQLSLLKIYNQIKAIQSVQVGWSKHEGLLAKYERECKTSEFYQVQLRILDNVDAKRKFFAIYKVRKELIE